MKVLAVCLSAMLLCACLSAQTPAPAQAPSTQAPTTQSAPPMHDDMGPGMHPEHMQKMKAQLAKMHMTLDQMKLNLTKVKDPAAKQQAQLDIDLWQSMVQHLDGMVKMMSDHPMGHEGMGHDGTGHHGMGMQMACCAGMKEGENAGGCCGGMKCMQGTHHEMDKGSDGKLPE